MIRKEGKGRAKKGIDFEDKGIQDSTDQELREVEVKKKNRDWNWDGEGGTRGLWIVLLQ